MCDAPSALCDERFAFFPVVLNAWIQELLRCHVDTGFTDLSHGYRIQ